MAIAADVSNMEKLCRSNRAELDAAEFYGGCNQPVRWKRIDCLGEKDSPLVHRALVQYMPG